MAEGAVENGVSSTRDALLRLAAESGGGEDLADLITHQNFSSLFTDGVIIGDTVLHDAVRCGDSTAIDAILDQMQFSSSRNLKGALCRKRNAFGNTALHEAVMMGHVEGVKILFSADEVVAHYPNEECKSPLYLAIENRNKQIVDILLPSTSSFLYQHIWRHQQSSSAPAEESDKIIRRLKKIEERNKKKLKVPDMRRQGGQPSNSHLKLQFENCKAKGILACELLQCIKGQNLFNFVSTLEQKCIQEQLWLSDIVNGISPTGDTLLHMAVSEDMVGFISFHFPQLVTRRNTRGDTALHVAVRTRRLDNMIIILTCYAEHFKNGFYIDESETLCTIRNVYGNTALHEAVMINDIEGASLLFSADKIVTHYLNNQYKSPLYLAVENENQELVDVLLHAPFHNVESQLGNSPLHAAILKKSSGGLILKKLLDKRPDLIQRRDQKGGSPLHFAAYIGYVEGVRMLVEARPLTALERNAKGYLPIHVASKKGHVKVVKEIVELEWFDPLAWLNLKGQNILHIAAKNGRHQVVSYILREKKLEKLLNERDKNGNTPLHLASKYLFPKVLLLLTQDKRVEVNLSNNQLMFSRDIVHSKGWEYLRVYKGRMAFRLFKNTIRWPDTLWLKDRSNILMVVAILVATVTFAAGFTVPGGFFSSDDPDLKKRGMAIMVNRRMFQVFAICDAIAMYSSAMAAFILLWSQVGDFHLACLAHNISVALVAMALPTMTIAFMAGLHMVMASLSWLAWAVISIGAISLLFILFGFIVLLFPLRFRTPISGIIYRLLIPLTGSYGKLPKKKKETKELEQQLQETRQVRIDMP